MQIRKSYIQAHPYITYPFNCVRHNATSVIWREEVNWRFGDNTVVREIFPLNFSETSLLLTDK